MLSQKHCACSLIFPFSITSGCSWFESYSNARLALQCSWIHWRLEFYNSEMVVITSSWLVVAKLGMSAKVWFCVVKRLPTINHFHFKSEQEKCLPSNLVCSHLEVSLNTINVVPPNNQDGLLQVFAWANLSSSQLLVFIFPGTLYFSCLTACPVLLKMWLLESCKFNPLPPKVMSNHVVWIYNMQNMQWEWQCIQPENIHWSEGHSRSFSSSLLVQKAWMPVQESASVSRD